MSKGLIWQDEENIIDVVYQTICGIPVKEAIRIVEQYSNRQLIPIDYIENWYKTHVYYLKEEKPIIYAYENMIIDWRQGNG